MTGYQTANILPTHPFNVSKTGAGIDVSKIVEDGIKGWSDFLKNDPVGKTVQATSVVPAPGGKVSATTDPSTVVDVPSIFKRAPAATTNDWMKAGASAEIQAKFGQPTNINQNSGPGFWGKAWNGFTHLLSLPGKIVKGAITESSAPGAGLLNNRALGDTGIVPQHQGNTTVGKVVTGAIHGAEGKDDNKSWGKDVFQLPQASNSAGLEAAVKQLSGLNAGSFLGNLALSLGIGTGGDSVKNTALRTLNAGADFAGEQGGNLLTYVPGGAPLKLAGKLFKPAAEAAEAIAPEAEAAVAPTFSDASHANVEPQRPLFPAPTPAAPVASDAETVAKQAAGQAAAQTAKQAQNAAISDQMALFNPPPITQTHVTVAEKPIPDVPAVSPSVAGDITATANLEDAVATGKPVSESLAATLADQPTSTVVRHRKLGVIDIPTLDAHLKDIRAQLDVARADFNKVKKSLAGDSSEGAATAIRTAQKRSTDLTREYNYSLKLKKEAPQTVAKAAGPEAGNPSLNSNLDTSKAAEHPLKTAIRTGIDATGEPIPKDILKIERDEWNARNPDDLIPEKSKAAEPVEAKSAGRTPEIIRREMAANQDIMDQISIGLMDAKGLKYKKLDALFDKHAKMHDDLTDELNAAKAAPVSEQLEASLAPNVEEAAATETHQEIAQGAYDHVVNGTGPELTPMPDRVDAISTEHLPSNSALRTRGRPGFPRIKHPETGKTTALKDGGQKYITSLESSAAGRDAYQKVVLPNLPQNLEGIERAQAAEDIYAPLLQKYKEDGIAAGWTPHTTAQTNSVKMEGKGYPLWPSDVHDVAMAHEGNPHFITAPSYTSARDMVVPQGAQMVAAAKALDIAHLSIPEAEKIAQIVTAMKAAGEKSGFAQNNVAYTSFAKAMVDGTPDLIKTVQENLAGIVTRRTSDAQTVLNRANQKLVDAISGPSATRTSRVQAIAHIGKDVNEAAAEVGAHPDSAAAAAAGHAHFAAQQGIDDVELAAARNELGKQRVINKSRPGHNGAHDPKAAAAVAAKDMKQMGLQDASTDAAVTRTMNPQQKAVYDDAVDVGTKSIYRTNENLKIAIADSIQSGIRRGAADQGIVSPRDYVRQGRDGGAYYQNVYGEDIRNIRNQLGGDNLSPQTAIRAMQNGTVPDATVSTAAKAYDLMLPKLQQIFDVGPGAKSTFGKLFSNGHSIEEINTELRSRGMKEFQIDPDLVPKDDPLYWEKTLDQWKTWDFGGDPLGKMNQLYNAMVGMNSTRNIGLDVARHFGSPTYRPGWSKIKNTQTKQFITQYIPKDTYFPKDTIVHIGDLEAGMRNTNKFGTQYAAGRFMNNTWIPVMNLLKQTMTTMKPSFVMHTFSGDYMISGMADDVWNPVYYQRAADQLSSLGILQHGSDDIAAALKGASTDKKDYLRMTLADGKTKTFSKTDVIRRNIDHGMIQKYYPADTLTRDLLSGTSLDAPSKLGRLANKLSSSAPMRYTGELATKASSLTRLAQMDKLLRDSNFTKGFKTEEEAWQAAAARTMWSHPDPGGMTHFESKWMRQFIPFYTWQRSIIMPTILTTINNPKTLPLFFNFMQFMNTIAGSNEGNVGDPGNDWDAYTLRPDMITNNPFGAPGNIGGIARNFIGGGTNGTGGQSVGASFGTPIENLIGTSGLLTGGNVKHPGLGGALAGMIPRTLAQTSPLIQGLYGLATGNKLTDTGSSQIKNTGDYIDDMLPFLNTLSDVSGVSAAGTIGNAATGNFQWAKQAAVQKGDKEQWKNLSLLNLISPMTLSDPNTVSLHNIALKQLLTKEGMTK